LVLPAKQKQGLTRVEKLVILVSECQFFKQRIKAAS